MMCPAIELPEGVAVIVSYKHTYANGIRRAHKISHGYYLQRTLNYFISMGYEFRIYPMCTKTKYTKIDTWEAWAEGMTLDEFLDYLND